MMSWLSFRLPMQSMELEGLDVPIEVRDENMTLVASTLASQGVLVQPGTYVVTAALPGGQRVVKVVEAANENEQVTLEVPARQASPHEWREVGHFFASAHAQRAVRVAAEQSLEGLESLGPVSAPAVIRMFAGNLLAGERRPIDVDAVRQDFMSDVAHLRCSPATELRYVQLLQPGRPPVNIALPTSHLGCTIAVHREPDRYWIEVHPADEQGNLLLGYTQNRMLQPQERVAEGLLSRKRRDPIAGTVGAYALLRSGDLNLLRTWTENLKEWFDWLPDGAAVRGEHLARLGRHEEALASFLDVPKRGLPVFSDGIRFTHDRLRTYHALGTRPEEIEGVLNKLRAFVSYVDFEKAVTTFTGLDPAKPDDKPVAKMPAKQRLDLAPLFV